MDKSERAGRKIGQNKMRKTEREIQRRLSERERDLEKKITEAERWKTVKEERGKKRGGETMRKKDTQS